MRCPFCAENVHDDALLCRHCGQQLFLVKPMQEQVTALKTRISELEAENARLAAELPPDHPAHAPAKLAVHALEYTAAGYVLYFLCVPVLTLILCHFVLVYVYDVNTLYLRIVSLLVPVPFGHALAADRRWTLTGGLVTGIVIAVLSVTGMSAVVAFHDRVPMLPADAREWRETGEYMVSIALSAFAGFALAHYSRRRTLGALATATGAAAAAVAVINMTSVVNRVLFKTDAKRSVAERVRTVESLLHSTLAIAAAAGSIFTGVHSVLK